MAREAAYEREIRSPLTGRASVALDGEILFGRWLFIALFEAGWTISTISLCYLFGLFRPYFQSNRSLHVLYRTISLLFVFFAVKLAVGSAKVLLH